MSFQDATHSHTPVIKNAALQIQFNIRWRVVQIQHNKTAKMMLGLCRYKGLDLKCISWQEIFSTKAKRKSN